MSRPPSDLQQLVTLLSTPPSRTCTPSFKQKMRNLHEPLDQHANTSLTQGNRAATIFVVQIRSGKREPSFTHLHQRFCIVPPVPPSMNSNDHNSFCDRNPKGGERKLHLREREECHVSASQWIVKESNMVKQSTMGKFWSKFIKQEGFKYKC